MGTVYRALDHRLDRTVAIKLVPESGDGSPSILQRIEHEARALSRLKHPHICTLYDIGEADGPAGHKVSFLVLELIEGESLADRVARGPIPLPEALAFAVQIADALQAAHRAGIVHGDLKPGNVMISGAGVKLLDFGLAREAQPAVTGSVDAVTAPASPGGNATVLGTLRYLAPEQLEGRNPDARSDVFSCGAVIYEMVTGRAAFSGETPAAVVAAIMHRTPPPVLTAAPGPSALDHAISVCLAKNPDDRWQDAGDLMRELAWIAAGGSAAAVPMKPTPDRRGLAAIAAALVAAAIVAAALYARPEAPPALPYRTSILLPEGLQFPLPGALGGVGRFAISPDGRRLAFVATDPKGERRLWLRPLDSLTAQPLAGTERASSPFWSPDSLRIAFVADGQLKTIDPAGGAPMIVAMPAYNTTGAWSRDNTILYTPTAGSPLHRVPASGGPSLQVTTLNREDGEVLHRNPVLLADGRYVLFTSVGPREGGVTGARAIHAGRIDGSEPPRVVIASPTTARYAQGQIIFLRDNALVAQPLDLASLTLAGEPRVIADQVELIGPASAAFSVSDTGVLAYQPASGRGSRLTWVDRDGREVDNVSDPAEYGDLELSPDGGRAAVSVLDPDRNTRDLWVVDLTRGVRTRLTSDPADDVAPVWSPDGTEIIFASNRAGHFDLYRKAASGIGEDRMLFRDGAEKYPTSWSADGSAVLYWQLEADGTSLRTLPPSGAGQPRVFLDGPVSQGRLSPDGRWVVYDSTQSGQSEVYVVSFPEPSRRWRVSTDGGRLSRWRADGREILYAARDNRVMAAPVSATAAGLTIGSVQPLFEARPVGPRAFFAPSLDGSRFLLNTLRAGTPSVSIAVLQNWMNAPAPR
jgi:Tol biopolymer transport system component